MVVAFDIETTGLNPYEDKVTVIGIKQGGKISLHKLWDPDDGDELRIISSALKQVESTRETIIGFNNLKFDVPFLHGRLDAIGKWHKGWWWIYNKKWFDLYQFQGDNYVSQKKWLQKAGIKQSRPDLKGSDMPALFTKCRYDEIEAHIVDDLNTSEALFRYLKKERPELVPFD
jgi:predicted PolB exonuclease-like 3'-5' exonuclease